MVVDPVCKMTLDPGTAAAEADFEGARVYFCSDACRRRFLANPTGFGAGSPVRRADLSDSSCSTHMGHSPHRLSLPSLGVACGAGVLAATALLVFYFGLLTILSGWSFTLDQFHDYWPFIIALAVGFGIQIGLFTYLRRAVHDAHSGKVAAVTATTSGAAMVSCCIHYLVNLLPALGATGLVSFVGQYQIELFWVGLASNLAGIVYIGHRVFSFSRGV